MEFDKNLNYMCKYKGPRPRIARTMLKNKAEKLALITQIIMLGN